MIKCLLCNKLFKSITNTHLKKHNKTFKEYLIEFPESCLSSVETAERRSRTLKTKYANGELVPSMKGKHHSEDTKIKIGESHKGKIVSDVTKHKISEAHKGRIVTQETREKISKYQTGKKLSKEHIEILRNSRIGKKHTTEAREKMRGPRPNASGKNNHFYGKTHSKKTKELLSKIRSEAITSGKYNDKSSARGYKGWYYSEKMKDKFYFDSAVELLRMIKLDNIEEVIMWTKKHHITIEYFKDYIRNYTPDFLIEYSCGKKVLEEIKGYINNNCEEKLNALKKYCDNNSLEYRWITVKNFTVGREYRKFLEKLNRREVVNVII